MLTIYTDIDGGGTISFSEYIQALVSFGLFDVVDVDSCFLLRWHGAVLFS